MRADSARQAIEIKNRLVTQTVEHLKKEYDAHEADPSKPPACLDILVVSGGGDYGAFGAGFLKGWGKVPAGPMARPEFDIVTGVSTGALIAPFAFLGTNEDYEQIDQLYRHPKSDWVKPRGAFAFMPGNASFATLPGLERDIRTAMDRPFIERIASSARDFRILFINTTNLDDGSAHSVYLSDEAISVTKSGDLDRFYSLVIASASIPGAFPPQEIDAALYCDGGVTSNILYGGAMGSNEGTIPQWRKQYPNLPIPAMRYWIVFNNQIHAVPKTIQARWPDVIERTVEIVARAATVIAIRHLFTMAELTAATSNGRVEVRLIAIPDDWRPPVPGAFQTETMNDLADLGERLGADSSSWQTQMP